MRSHNRLLSSLAATAALVLLAGGCIFSPDDDPNNVTPPPPSYPFPDTEDKLMTNFKTAYDNMSIEEYRNALHSDYKFVFADGSPVAPYEGYYTREQDLQSTTRMFNGEQGQDQDGVVKPGVRDIEFIQLLRTTNWEPMPISDPDFSGAMYALFEVRIVFYLNTESTNTITIDSEQLFYLESVEEEQNDGSTRTRFYLIGQRDLN